MKKLFHLLSQHMLEGKDVVLATVIASSGSTPRGVGARMLINKDGRIYGTIGGGLIEYKSEQIAIEILKTQRSFSKGFKLKRQDIEDLGMICGGDAIVYFQYIPAGNKKNYNVIKCILDMFERDEDSWIILDISDETAWDMGVYSKSSSIVGLELNENELKYLLKNRSIQIKIGKKKYYSEPLVRAGKVIIFGGGHIAQELVPVISHLGFRIVVIDDRKDFANKKIFPMADKISLINFENILQDVDITENDYVIIVTRGHNYDLTVQKQALRTDAAYIGVIGSRQKIADTNAKLIDAGIPEMALKRIFSPIGLPIRGETPAEIAISIAGELILVRSLRHEKNGYIYPSDVYPGKK